VGDWRAAYESGRTLVTQHPFRDIALNRL